MVAIFTGAGTGLERGSGSVLGGAGLLGSASMGRGGEKLFLNAANGNLVINRQDEILLGRGPDLGINRTYNSRGNYSDENGDNWRQSTDRKVFDLVGAVNGWGSTVRRRGADGAEISYSFNGSVYVATDGAGAYDTLSYNGAWTWRDGESQVAEVYEAYGAEWRITSQRDTSGNTVSFAYSADKLVQVSTADGGTIQYGWSGNNITSIVTSSQGTTLTRTRYGYDGYGRLASVTVDLSPGDNSVADGQAYTTSYSYYGASRLVSAIAQSDGSRVDLYYDDDNRIVGVAETVVDGVTRTTSLAYGAGYTNITDPVGQTTTLYYDGAGALTRIDAPPAQAGMAQQVVQFGYNGNGDLASVVDASGNVTSYGYDGWGNTISQTDRLGNAVTRTFNAANQLLTETRVGSDKDSAGAQHTDRYVYDGANRLRFTVSAAGRVTEYRYDGYGQLAVTLEYNGQFYDTSGLAATTPLDESQLVNWVGSLADPSANAQVHYGYDARGGLTQKVSYGAAYNPYAPHTAYGYTHEYFTYDQAGQLLANVVAGQNWQNYVYDGLGRLTAKTDVNGGTTSFVFNDAASQTVVTLANGFVQTSTYNRAGELVSFTESGAFVAGGSASYQYDRNGRLRVTTDASGVRSYYLYDKVGRKIADINEYGWVTEYRYDANDRLVATVNYTNGIAGGGATMALLADPNSNVEIAAIRPPAHSYDVWKWSVYDKEGRIVEAIEGDGSVATYEYDASGRLVRTTAFVNKLAGWQVAGFQATSPTAPVLPGGHANDSVSRIFYDKDGRTIGTLDGEGYLSRVDYDAAGRKVFEVAYANATYAPYRAGNSLQDLINSVGSAANDASTRYVYDQQDNLRFTIDGLGHVTEYGYEYAGWTWSAFGVVRQTIVYADAIGALSSYSYENVRNVMAGLAGNSANRTSWSVYDDAGRLAYTIDANGGVVGYAYDNVGQLTRKVEYANLRWTGSLPSKADMDGWVASYPTASDRITRYYYSARGELRFTIDAEGYVTRNDYDAEGRLTFTARWDAPVAADDGWSIYTVNGAVGGNWAGSTNQYDASGRLTYRIDGEGHTRRYYYYANGQLAWDIRMEGQAEDSRTLYVYDPAGRLVVQYDAYGTAEQAVTQLGYDGHGNLVSRVDPLGRTTGYAYDKAGRKVSETNPLGGTTSFAYDAFGDLVRTTDARGNSSYSYYDKLGRIVLTRDAEDYVTETSYTAFGEVAAITRRFNKAYNAAGADIYPAYGGHGSDATTAFEYDKLGRLTRTIDALGNYEQYTLDAFGNRASVRNKLGGVVANAYDRRGLLVAETLPMASTDMWGNTVASTVTNRYGYDARGNRVWSDEAQGLAEHRYSWYVYDKTDRLTEVHGDTIAYVDQSNHSSFGYTDLVERRAYDGRGNLIETVDANGARTLFYYDDLDRKIADVSAVGTLTTYSYDATSNLVASRIWGTPIGQPGSAGGTPPGAPGGEYRETTYGYDALNRMVWRSVAGVRTGAWNGASFALSTGAITFSYAYDADSNLVSTTDANGSVLYAYYDRLGHKIAQVDEEGFVTRWTLDAEGNVLQERRYATQTSGANVSAQPWVPDSGADRITAFAYDRNGQRIAEYRYNVEAYGVDGWGQLYGAGDTATVTYAYNGLGQVTRKTEATGDYLDYGYDAMGRLVQETRAPYADFTGNWVRPTVRYYYNGVNNLAMTRQGAEGMDGGDRITRYTYAARGRLQTMVDAVGAETQYYYDAAGNVVRQNYTRTKSDGGTAYEGLLYNRDVLGRVTAQSVGVWNGSWWDRGDVQNIAYNAYGEVAQRGLNGGWQEQFAYDGLGRLYRSTGTDGVWRYYVHDANGNQTATIESEGSWIGWLSLDGAISTATYGFAYGLGQVYVDGVNVTINIYDRRGQAVSTRLSQRQLSESAGAGDLVMNRGYNAFGETVWETDARGYQTNYGYNAAGRVTYAQRAAVIVTYENGWQAWVNPTEYYFYDIAGRMVGTQDANGARTTRALLAGTGYGGSEGLVTAEYHADGGVLRNGYDRFGDLRRATDEVGRTTAFDYDGMGRLIQLTRPSGQAEYYAYDLLGQRIRHWNSWYGGYNVETTDYDAQGRVVRSQAYGGDVTTTSYSWYSGIGTAGLGTFGGWVETTSYANGRSSTEYSDVFGHVTYSVDLGGHGTSYTYDLAGRMVQRSGLETVNYNYLNSGLLGSTTSGYGSAASAQANMGETYQINRTTYSYDAAGNRLSEVYTVENGGWYDYGWWEYGWDYYDQYWVSNWQYSSSVTTYQNASASYDALNRMVSWNEGGSYTVPAASISYNYDANGNVRRSYATYRTLDQNGNASGGASVQDYWYRYDSMNRVVTAKGQQAGGQIMRGYQGTDVVYNQAGERVQSSRTSGATASVYNPYYYYDPYDPYYYGDPYNYIYYDAESREDYTYDADGHLSTVSVAQSGYYDNGDGTITVTAPAATGDLKANYYYDGMGRLNRQIDWLYGGVAAYDNTTYYNDKGQAYYVTTVQRQGGDTITTYSSTDYGYGSNYALGAAVSTSVSTYKNGGYQYYATSANNYIWYASAVQSSVTYSQSNQATQTSYFYYTAAGQLNSIYVADGRPHTITFTNDMNGQVIRRDESDYNYSLGDPHEVWYRFGGKQLGYVGNNGTLNTDYQTSIGNRTMSAGTGAFQFGSSYGSAYADFDQNFQAITSYSQGSSGGAYTVRQGDTLASIAASLWGDSSLWYTIAEANGMSAASALTEGQALTIPSGVQRSAHNASTFKPYDPGEVMGDTSPTTPQPQKASSKKNKCGVFGTILLVVIAVAVTALTYGALGGAALTGIQAVGAGALAGAAGSVASQAVGVATGIQDKFSWKGVALAALGGAVGAGVGEVLGKGSMLGSQFVGDAVRGAVGSLVTQGVGVATGLQDRFDWAGVAAAGIGAAAGNGFARGVLKVEPGRWASGATGYAQQAATGMAGAIAGAATRSLINGSDFGDNVLAALPDVIGSTIGNMVSDAVNNAVVARKVNHVLEETGLATEDPGDNQVSRDVIRRFLLAGGTEAQAIEFASDDSINLGLRQWDATRAGGLSEDESARRLEDTIQRSEQRRAAETRRAAASAGGAVTDGTGSAADQAVAETQLAEVVVIGYRRGPGGSDIGANAVSGGINVLDGLTGFYDRHPIIAELGFEATRTVLTGGPVKALVRRAADVALDGVADQVSEFAATRATPFLTNLAADLGWELDVNVLGASMSIGAPEIGTGGGQLTGAVVGTVMGDGLESVVKRGRNIRNFFDPIRRINGRRVPNYRYAGQTFELSGPLGGKYPHGVPFNIQGFPDFARYQIRSVRIDLTGVDRRDFALADRAAGYTRANPRPAGYTWHHDHDLGTMRLIPTDLHDAVRHAGGQALYRERNR